MPYLCVATCLTLSGACSGTDFLTYMHTLDMLVYCSRSTYTKIGTIQRRLAWPLRKDDTQIREAFHIFSTFNFPVHSPQNSFLLKREKIRGEDTSEHRKAGKCWVLRRILQREASAIESELICGGSKSPCGLMDKALDF